jgi:hypothetical protein
LNAPSLPRTVLTKELDRTSDGIEWVTNIVELPDGTTLRTRERQNILVNLLPEVDREVTLLAHPTRGVRRLSDVRPRIERPETWYTPWSADLYGTIEDVDVDPAVAGWSDGGPFYVVNVGCGSIYVHSSLRDYLPESDLPLDKRTALYIPAALIEFLDVYP